ncbi:MAG: response regulator [Terriglobia bacterium]
MTSVRILIADDHALIRRGARELLETQPGWKVVGEAANGREAVEKSKRLKPDVVIVDLTMPDLNGIETTRQVLQAVPETEVLVLTLHDSERMIRDALDAGARGYVLKSDAEASLIEAVDAVRQRRPFFTGKAEALLLDVYRQAERTGERQNATQKKITPREREIVQLVAEGRSNKEIASRLNLSLHTVVTHRSNVMRKLDVHSVTELVRYAIRNDMIKA